MCSFWQNIITGFVIAIFFFIWGFSMEAGRIIGRKIKKIWN